LFVVLKIIIEPVVNTVS